MFYNQFPTSDTVHKWTFAPEVGQFHIGALTDVEPDTGADTKCPAMKTNCQIMFYNQLPTFDTIHKWSLAPELGHFHIGALTDMEQDTGADTKCPAMKLMCQIMFYNQLPTVDTINKWTLAPEVGGFHIGALINVEPGHWGGHQVSGYDRDVKNQVLYSIATF